MRHALAVPFLAVALAAALPASAEAQRRRGGPPREEVMERIRARFDAIVQRELGLDDAGAAELREIARAFQADRRALAFREGELRRRIRELGEPSLDGSGARSRPVDDAAAREILDRMAELRREEVALVEAEQERLGELLSPSQLLRYYQLREALARRIQGLRGERGPRRPGGPPGGPGRSF